jgi:hypothetical protein
MKPKVLTAPLAIVKVDGITVGKMKNITCTETFRRGRVSGLGELTPQELPATEWNGTLTAEFYEVEFNKTGLPEAIKRNAGSQQAFVDNVLLQEDGVNVTIYKKISSGIDANTGLHTAELQKHATIKGCFIDREGMNVSEGQIASHNQDFTYTTPILFNV